MRTRLRPLTTRPPSRPGRWRRRPRNAGPASASTVARNTVMFTGELRRRMTSVEQRLDFIDQHGTRGVEGIRQVQVNQAGDLGEIKAGMESIRAKVDAINYGGWRRSVSFAVAVA